MITKDNNGVYGAECFGSLLDELTKEMEDKTSKEKPIPTTNSIPNYYEFVPYTSRGTTYSIPKCYNDMSWSTDGDLLLSFAIGNADLRDIPCDTTSFFASESLKDKKLKIAIKNIIPSDLGNTLVLALYKEGTPEPLSVRTLYTEDFLEKSHIEIECSTDSYTFGNYFMLICGTGKDNDSPYDTMGDNIRYSFSILKHGAASGSASISNIALKKRENSHKEPTSGTVTLEMEFESRQTQNEIFTFLCTASNYMNMSAPVKYRPRNPNTKKIKVNFTSGCIWMKDTYHIYALHNSEPFYKATFSYDGTTFTLVETKKIDKHSPEYLFMKHLIEGEHERTWSDLSRMPGLSRCKASILSNLKQFIANSIRDKHGLKTIYSPCNYIVDFRDKKFLECFVKLATPHNDFEEGDCTEFIEPKYTSDPYEGLSEFIHSCNHSAMVLYNVGALLAPNGGNVLGHLEKWISEDDTRTLILCGTEPECRAVIATAPFLQKAFPKENIVKREHFTLPEQVHYMQRLFERYDYFMHEESEAALVRLLTAARDCGDAARWRTEELDRLFKESIYRRIVDRLTETEDAKVDNRKELLSILPEDLDIRFDSNTASEFEISMSGLNEMVGLGNLKEHFAQMFNYMRMEEKRRELGLTCKEQTAHHMIFTGNPGTGKTTVAEYIGKIFHSLGLLSKGEVIRTERTKLIGRYIGETERNMQRILEQARGNVLFIDEAYTLCDTAEDRKDFGSHVIDALLTVLAQPNPDMLVIMAGYKHEMDKMMNVNIGLEGRFPHKFHFEDYTADELMQIATTTLAKSDYVLEADAHDLLLEGIIETCANKDSHFSNARWILQTVANGILPAMSTRIMSCASILDRETLTTIKAEDVAAALDEFKYVPTKNIPRRSRIGFAV